MLRAETLQIVGRWGRAIQNCWFRDGTAPTTNNLKHFGPKRFKLLVVGAARPKIVGFGVVWPGPNEQQFEVLRAETFQIVGLWGRVTQNCWLRWHGPNDQQFEALRAETFQILIVGRWGLATPNC